jgi:hypothetical protein
MEDHMKKLVTVASGMIAGAVLMLSASAAMARPDVDVHVGAPSGHAYPAPVRAAERRDYPPARPSHLMHPDHHRQYDRHDYRHDYRRPPLPVRSRHDRDGDGVPNRFDARPDNPRRY